jgi:hypothetical protein
LDQGFLHFSTGFIPPAWLYRPPFISIIDTTDVRPSSETHCAWARCALPDP